MTIITTMINEALNPCTWFLSILTGVSAFEVTMFLLKSMTRNWSLARAVTIYLPIGPMH